MAADENRDLAFPACRRVEGYFGGACGNYVVDKNKGRCTARDDKMEKGVMYIIGDLSDDKDDDNNDGDGDGDGEEEGGEGEGEEGWGGSTRAQTARARREGFQRIITINNATEEEGAWMDKIWKGWHR